MLLTILGLLAAALSGSGALRLSSAKDRLEAQTRKYSATHADLDKESVKRTQAIESIGTIASRGVSNVVRAQKMLSPLSASWSVGNLSPASDADSAQLAIIQAKSVSMEFYAAAGVATGVATAGALWFGAQVIGIASTGMPIVFLHGAALHNAALACLGGGSLATSGGGMLAGSAVLASAVVLPASLFFGFKTHSEASRLNGISDEIETANKTNLIVLDKIRKANVRLIEVENELHAETLLFGKRVTEARKQLFRFGVATHLFRLLRSRWWGTYYTDDEMTLADGLSEATLRYTDLFEKFKHEPIN